VLIPKPDAKAVVQASKPFIEGESVILNYLKGDTITPKGLSEAQAECNRLLKQIAGK
jgi:hypothetical protein